MCAQHTQDQSSLFSFKSYLSSLSPPPPLSLPSPPTLQLLDQNMSKDALSEVIGSELTPDSIGSDSVDSSIHSEELHATGPSPSACPAPTTIVDLAVGVMGACLEVAEAMKEELSALVAPTDPSLVDLMDFECVLCTG